MGGACLEKMKRKKEEKIIDTSIFLPAIMLAVGLLVFSCEMFNYNFSIKKPIYFIAENISESSENSGKAVYEYLSVLLDIPAVQSRIDELEIENSKYKSNQAYITMLEEENGSLRDQLELGNNDHTYVDAHVLGAVDNNTILVNAGELRGIKVGDTVLLGYTFIGIVMKTTDEASIVRLPLNESSSLEVWITSDREGGNLLSRAVVRGTGDGIIIENIDKKAGVKKGDYVVINDERVVDNLVLGTISDLDENPASTSYNGYVEPFVDYNYLNTLFICVEW